MHSSPWCGAKRSVIQNHRFPSDKSTTPLENYTESAFKVRRWIHTQEKVVLFGVDSPFVDYFWQFVGRLLRRCHRWYALPFLHFRDREATLTAHWKFTPIKAQDEQLTSVLPNNNKDKSNVTDANSNQGFVVYMRERPGQLPKTGQVVTNVLLTDNRNLQWTRLTPFTVERALSPWRAPAQNYKHYNCDHWCWHPTGSLNDRWF